MRLELVQLPISDGGTYQRFTFSLQLAVTPHPFGAVRWQGCPFSYQGCTKTTFGSEVRDLRGDLDADERMEMGNTCLGAE